jgi:tetratricopeptide (TPR) repeat protein
MQQARERGAALERERRWEEAAEVYRSALARLSSADARDDRIWLLTSLAEISFERREYGEARRWLREAEGLDPDAAERVRLLNASGTLHLVEGNLTAAQRDLSQAVAVSATPADLAAALHNLAAVEMQTRRLEDATVHETKALALWRQELGDRHYYVMKAWIGLSSAQGLRGNWQAAEDSLRNALAIAETPEALANYAVVLEKLKRGREAGEIRRRLGRQSPAASPLVDVKAMPLEREQLRVWTR